MTTIFSGENEGIGLPSAGAGFLWYTDHPECSLAVVRVQRPPSRSHSREACPWTPISQFWPHIFGIAGSTDLLAGAHQLCGKPGVAAVNVARTMHRVQLIVGGRGSVPTGLHLAGVICLYDLVVNAVP